MRSAEKRGGTNSQSWLPFGSRRSSPAGQCHLFKVVLYYEAPLWTALCCARREPGSLTTEQCVDQPSQDGGSRLTGACRQDPLEGFRTVSVMCPSDQPPRWKERWTYKPTVIHIGDPSPYDRTVTHQEDSSSCGRILLRDEKHSWSVETQTQDLFLSKNFDGEFDPGSGRTLAVRLMHASRGRSSCSVRFDCGNRRTGA